MSNALQVHTGEPVAKREEPKALGGMAPMTFEGIIAMGDALVQTGFLPKHITTGAKAAAIILAGQELGMAPMRALRSLILVEGKVVENADSQLARFKSDGGRAVWKELDEKGAVLWLRHPNGDEHTETFTIKDAEKAKLLGKDVWQKYPKAMLRSRVITAGLKSIGWEGGAGAYDPDEAQGFAPSSSQPAIATVANGEEPENATTTEPPAPREPTPTAERTAEWANAYAFPFDRKKQNGNYGKPLSSFSSEHLVSVGEWIVEKQKEKSEPAFHAETLDAIYIVLRERERDQTTLTFDDNAAQGSPTDVMPPAGRVHDAFNPSR